MVCGEAPVWEQATIIEVGVTDVADFVKSLDEGAVIESPSTAFNEYISPNAAACFHRHLDSIVNQSTVAAKSGNMDLCVYSLDVLRALESRLKVEKVGECYAKAIREVERNMEDRWKRTYDSLRSLWDDGNTIKSENLQVFILFFVLFL